MSSNTDNSKIITNLREFTSSDVESGDLLFITDISTVETKKISAVDFSVYALSVGGIVSGAYVLMELELTPSNVDTLSSEIEEYLQETVQ
jgi:hypothetical protein